MRNNTLCNYYYYYLESAVQGRERVRRLYQSKDPNPTQPTHGIKKKKKKKINSRRHQIKPRRSCQQESIISGLGTRQSHTIKHRVTKIIPKRHREGHKGSEMLRSPTARRGERVKIKLVYQPCVCLISALVLINYDKYF